MVLAVTVLVLTVNVALVAPAATVTEAGTWAAAALLASDTAKPPAGAAAVRVTVPVAELPPVTLAGLTLKVESAGPVALGFTVKEVVAVLAPELADSWATVLAVTAVVVTVNVALVAPAATVT